MVSKLSLTRALSGADVDDVQDQINDNISDISDNTTHKDGDGSDHADVATNTAHGSNTSNPHSTTFTQSVAADGGTDVSAAEMETLTDGSNADALHVHASLGGSGTWDVTVGTAGDRATLTLVNTNETLGDSVKIFTETITDDPTFSKSFGMVGGGFRTKIVGDITFASGSDGASLRDVYIQGTLTIDADVKNLLLTNIWMDDPQTDVIDDSGNSYNVLTNFIKVN